MLIIQGALFELFELILGTHVALAIDVTNKSAEANQEAKATKSKIEKKGDCHE